MGVSAVRSRVQSGAEAADGSHAALAPSQPPRLCPTAAARRRTSLCPPAGKPWTRTSPGTRCCVRPCPTLRSMPCSRWGAGGGRPCGGGRVWLASEGWVYRCIRAGLCVAWVAQTMAVCCSRQLLFLHISAVPATPAQGLIVRAQSQCPEHDRKWQSL